MPFLLARLTPPLAALTTLCLLASPLFAQPPAIIARDAAPPPPRVHPQTGRDLANWPPDRLFDTIHLKARIEVPNVEEELLHCSATLTVMPIGQPRDTLTLNARDAIKIKSIAVAGKPVKYTRTGTLLTIALPSPAPLVQMLDIQIDYDVKGPFGDGVGLTFVPPDSDRNIPPMLYSQGEADWNSAWLPIHDFPHERFTTELIITVPEGFTALSNGEPVNPPVTDGGKTTFHYHLKKPQPGYLITLAVGKFEEVLLGRGRADGPECRVYGKPGDAEQLRKAFAKTPAMLSFLEDLYGIPYPWGSRYGQVLVRNFRWGGMENTTMTTLSDNTLEKTPGEIDELVVHELAHHWTGNLVTCKSWEHTWLNEGWATYVEGLWAEHNEGKPGYQRYIAQWRDKIIENCKGTAPASQPMVTNRYLQPDDIFEQAEDPYDRGALVLHMLRVKLGDKLFYEALKNYVAKHAFQAVETDDFRKVCEATSGLSLERFFYQWCKRPGVPRLRVSFVWDDAASEATITLDQTQTVNASNPAYDLRLPIVFTLDNDKTQTLVIATDEKRAVAKLKLGKKPSSWAVDPEMTVLADVKTEGNP